MTPAEYSELAGITSERWHRFGKKPNVELSGDPMALPKPD
jgi:hypothetical protein